MTTYPVDTVPLEPDPFWHLVLIAVAVFALVGSLTVVAWILAGRLTRWLQIQLMDRADAQHRQEMEQALADIQRLSADRE